MLYYLTDEAKVTVKCCKCCDMAMAPTADINLKNRIKLLLNEQRKKYLEEHHIFSAISDFIKDKVLLKL